MPEDSASVSTPASPAEPADWQAIPHPEEMKAGFQLRWGTGWT